MKGFASMKKEQQEEIARKGGLAAAQKPGHMSEIGRKGGIASGIKRAERKALLAAIKKP